MNEINYNDWYLNITPEQFDEIYAGIEEVLELKYMFYTHPTNDKEYFTYLASKLWRLNNLYTIVDKYGKEVILNMKTEQHISYAESIKHPRLIILKTRQLGISTFWLISFLDDSIFLNNIGCGLMAQDLASAKKLNEKIKLAWTRFDEELKEFLDIKIITDNKAETVFNNGSSISIKTSFRSGTLQRLHISELGKIAQKNPDKAEETNTGSLQTITSGNTVVIESTAEGENNMFAYKWFDSTEVEDRGDKLNPMQFKPIFFSWVDDKDCTIEIYTQLSEATIKYCDKVEMDLNIKLSDPQKWWVETKRVELGDKFSQEYPYNPASAFAQSRDGTYYGEQFKQLIDDGRMISREEIYTKYNKVDVVFDLGINDTMVLHFFQSSYNLDGSYEVRLIDTYYNNGEALSHYVDVLKQKAKRYGYKYDRFVLPHDAKKRELGSNKSIAMQLRDLGLKHQTVLPLMPILDGIQAVRAMLKVTWINKDLAYTIKAFKGYTKEWNDKLGVWRDKPLHNEYSNPMDAVRYYAMYKIKDIVRKKSRKSKKPVLGDMAV